MNTFLALLLLLPSLSFAKTKFTLKTTSFNHRELMPNKHVFNGFGCSGENISPALEWENAPKGTKSFAITVFDPDAPTGSGWWHWTLVNIPASVTKIEEGASNKGVIPAGAVEGRTDFGKPGYGGPCPPPGRTHHFIFTVWALKTDKIDVTQESSGANVGFLLNANALDKTKFVVKYRR